MRSGRLAAGRPTLAAAGVSDPWTPSIGSSLALTVVVAGNDSERFEVLESIGKGGMAVVHRAVQRGAGTFRRTVALKRMLPHLVAKPELVERFVSEAEVASQLNHPNIAQVYDFGSSRGELFIAMEYVDGISLRQLIRLATRAGKRIPLRVVLSLLRQLASALDHVHRRTGESGLPLGLAHRDISPSNIMISRDGHLKLIDFGVAAKQSDPSSSRQGVVGKLAYMAPEELAGPCVDPRSDLWAFGVLAWEMVTLGRLFAARSDYETVQRVLHAPIHAPSEFEPSCPLELDLVILAALTRHPNARTQSARELLRDLDDLVTSAQININSSVVAEWLVRELRDLVAPPVSPPTSSVGSAPPELASAEFIATSAQIAVLTTLEPCGELARASVVGSCDLAIGAQIVAPRPIRWLPTTVGAVSAAIAFALVARSPSSSSSATKAEPEAAPIAAASPPALAASHSLVIDSPRSGVAPAPLPELAPPVKPSSVRRARAKQRIAFVPSAYLPEATETRAVSRDGPIPTSIIGSLKLADIGLEPAAKPAAKPASPRLIRPTAVRRISGALPSLRLRRDALEGTSGAHLSARLCTSRTGHVQSVKVLSRAPLAAKRQVVAALSSWRFSPYLAAGQPIAVCFTKQFKVQTR